MKILVLAAAVVLSAMSAATAETPRENAARHGDLFIPYGPQPPTAAQLRADPKLRRYPGLTPLEHDTANQHLGPDKPTPKSVCYSQWDGNTSRSVCY
jgi:hypothetical protein